MRWVVASLTVGVLVAGVAKEARAQGVIVDHRSVALFDQIPDQYVTAAAAIPMVYVNRSVGFNISEGLSCLAYASDAVALASCKRYTHIVPQFSSPASEVVWSRPGGYNRTLWQYFNWPGLSTPPELPCGVDTGMWYNKLECFIRYVDANPNAFRVYSYMSSYLEVADEASDIISPTNGYFARQPNRYDIADWEAMEARHPTKTFLLHTTSLARGVGTRVSVTFNNQMRQYARDRNKYLLDVADIESHDPWGNPCYDNRDGVPYSAGGASENLPDDGMSIPAICQHYTRESEGGHLGNPDVGKIRIAKAFWVLMARVAGWNPGNTTSVPSAPTNLRIVPGQ